MKLADFEVLAREAAQEALSDYPRLVPGEEQCRWCLAQGSCKALADYAMESALEAFDDSGFQKLNELSADDLSWVLSRAKTVESWLKSVQEEAKGRLMGGDELPGYKLVEGRKLRRWVDERDAEKFLAGELGDDAFKERQLITPAQAEKALGKKHPDLGAYIELPEGPPTLAPESDKRPALVTSAAQVFEDLTED